MDKPEVRVDPIPIPPLPFEETRIQRERITKQDINEFGATIGCPGCNAIRDNTMAQAHSDLCRRRIEECLRATPHGAERLDRRNEVVNEALAEEVQRRRRAVLESEPAASAASEPGEAPTAAAVDSKRNESRKQVEDMSEMVTGESIALPGAPSANTGRRIVLKSEPVAVTTQEASPMSNKLNWATSWSCRSRVRCSNGQDDRTSLEDCHYQQRMDGT